VATLEEKWLMNKFSEKIKTIGIQLKQTDGGKHFSFEQYELPGIAIKLY